jgi:hypothetical protein
MERKISDNHVSTFNLTYHPQKCRLDLSSLGFLMHGVEVLGVGEVRRRTCITKAAFCSLMVEK